MPYLQTAKLKIHYQMAGDGDTPLLLLHGNFATGRWWQLLLADLPPTVRAYAPDMRGCGATEKPDGGYTINQLTEDVEAFHAALINRPCHVVGHSLGGAVAVQFALNQPDLVQSLLLLSPAPANGLENLHMNRWARHLNPQSGAVQKLTKVNYKVMRTLGADRPILSRALRNIMPTLTDETLFESLVDDATTMAIEAIVGFWQSLDEWDVSAELDRLTMPILILAGEQDSLVPVAPLRQMARQLPQAQLAVWPDVGHSAQVEQPERFVRLLGEFLATRAHVEELTAPPPAALAPTPPKPSRLQRLWHALKNGLSKVYHGVRRRLG